MEVIRESSLSEYAAWYLQRDSDKHKAKTGAPKPIPDKVDDQLKMMWNCHGGKMRPWFANASQWSIVRIDLEEFEHLIFLDTHWTKAEGLTPHTGPDYRILKQVAYNALKIGYLSQAKNPRHLDYYKQLEQGKLTLQDASRIAICSAEPSEVENNPSANFYILDGAGRSLPYMILLQEGKLPYVSVEAFLAKRNT